MTIYLLGKEPVFPPAQHASPAGIIAVGGDLSSQRLLNAYGAGIFPWFSANEPLLWWSPDPRMIVLPENLHVSKSMKKLLKKNQYKITFDRNFKEVITQCALPRKEQQETWITGEMKKSYIELHRLGFAHSVEIWERMNSTQNKKMELVGGLYGVSLGRCFFGESMFSRRPNTSKLAFIIICQVLFQAGYIMMDCQLPTDHLRSLGAREVSRNDYLSFLKTGLNYPTIAGKWNFPFPFFKGS